MKNFLVAIALAALLPSVHIRKQTDPYRPANLPLARNLIIVTIDGFRWQELFMGADSTLIHSEDYISDTDLTKLLYWDDDVLSRRKKLLPFFWNVLAKKGQIFGNRNFGNRVNAANDYSLSYPGYNEIFTGNTDVFISSNRKIQNPNINVLEYLNTISTFKDKIAVFTSWDAFPYILNRERSGLPVNSGYNTGIVNSNKQYMINTVQENAVTDKKATRYDQLTFMMAREYIAEKQPRLLYLGLGETDEYAHDGRYDLYLEKANQADKMIAELWGWVQQTPGYKNNTTLLITTDHGRGSKTNRWSSHGQLVKGSSQTWLAMLGPGIAPLGEIKEEGQIYQKQLARSIAGFVGEDFPAGDAAEAISLKQSDTKPINNYGIFQK